MEHGTPASATPTWSATLRLAAHPEAFLDAGRVGALMQGVLPDDVVLETFDDIDAPSIVHADRWSKGRAMGHAEILAAAARHGSDRRVLRQMLLVSAPMAAVLGGWLQGLSAPGVFEDPIHLELLALLAEDVGVGRTHASRGDALRALFDRFEVAVGTLDLQGLALHPAIPDAALALPAVLLAMSRRSDAFAPELCGVDLALRSMRVLPCWSMLRERHPDWIDWSRLDLGTMRGDPDGEAALASSRRIAARLCAIDATVRTRLLRSAAWTLAAVRAWDDTVREQAATAADPYAAMAALVRSRARDAAAYHHAFRIDGEQMLSDLFARAHDDPAPLIEALARSPLIKPGASAASALVNGLVAPTGKMFRVFSEDELAVVRTWIDELPHSATPAPRDATRRIPPPTDVALEGGNSDPNLDGCATPRDTRDAYFLLQGRALSPPLRRYAVAYVEAWMSWAARPMDRAGACLPADFPRDGLRPWLAEQHAKANRHFAANADTAEMPTREAIVDSSLQLAPLLCIDGAWLQGYTDVQLARSTVGASLFAIYWDELGNGRYDLNHPKLYRDLLRAMQVELPPTGSRQFAQDERLRDESFALPVLWLCLGKLPLRFLPEILGMNLAMELSGVGDGYRSAHRFLQHHRFATHFVDLHNTIDNVATGHSAWAADAVAAHMTEHALHAGGTTGDAQWARVRRGFASLTASLPANGGWRKRLGSLLAAGSAKPARSAHAAALHHRWTDAAAGA